MYMLNKTVFLLFLFHLIDLKEMPDFKIKIRNNTMGHEREIPI